MKDRPDNKKKHRKSEDSVKHHHVNVISHGSPSFARCPDALLHSSADKCVSVFGNQFLGIGIVKTAGLPHGIQQNTLHLHPYRILPHLAVSLPVALKQLDCKPTAVEPLKKRFMMHKSGNFVDALLQSGPEKQLVLLYLYLPCPDPHNMVEQSLYSRHFFCRSGHYMATKQLL